MILIKRWQTTEVLVLKPFVSAGICVRTEYCKIVYGILVPKNIVAAFFIINHVGRSLVKLLVLGRQYFKKFRLL